MKRNSPTEYVVRWTAWVWADSDGEDGLGLCQPEDSRSILSGQTEPHCSVQEHSWWNAAVISGFGMPAWSCSSHRPPSSHTTYFILLYPAAFTAHLFIHSSHSSICGVCLSMTLCICPFEDALEHWTVCLSVFFAHVSKCSSFFLNLKFHITPQSVSSDFWNKITVVGVSIYGTQIFPVTEVLLISLQLTAM